MKRKLDLEGNRDTAAHPNLVKPGGVQMPLQLVVCVIGDIWIIGNTFLALISQQAHDDTFKVPSKLKVNPPDSSRGHRRKAHACQTFEDKTNQNAIAMKAGAYQAGEHFPTRRCPSAGSPRSAHLGGSLEFCQKG